MRLIKQHFESNGSGRVMLYPEEPEDMVRPLTLNFQSDSISGTCTT